MSASATIKATLRSAAGGLALGGFLYLVADTASDFVTFAALRGAAMQLVGEDQELQQLLGVPYTTGPWYNATLGFSHRDKVAHCTFQVQGSARVTDVAVKAGRGGPGPKSLILFNLAGPASWQLISCQAMVPAEGGLVQPRSLLREHRQQQQQQVQRLSPAAAAAAAAAAGCQPGQQQQVGGSGAAVATTAAAATQQQHGWQWWPWRRGGSSSGGSSGGTLKGATNS